MMKVIEKLFNAVCIAIFLFPNSATAQGINRGELLASMCVTCHGPEGQGSKRIPPLDNHTVQEHTEYMNGFKDGSKSATIMDRHASSYSDEEINLIAKYFYEAQ